MLAWGLGGYLHGSELDPEGAYMSEDQEAES